MPQVRARAARARRSRRSIRETGSKLPRAFYRPRRRSTSPATCSARCWCIDAAACVTSGVIVEVEAYIGETDPACHAAPGPTRRNAAALRHARPRLRLSELRHPLPGERRHRGARLAGGGADPRARSARRHRRDAPAARARDERAASAAGCRRAAAARALPRPRQSDDGDGDYAGGEPARSPRRSALRRGSRHRVGAIGWGPRIGIRVGTESPWRAWVDATTTRVSGCLSSLSCAWVVTSLISSRGEPRLDVGACFSRSAMQLLIRSSV